jgi:hypothetical protein
MLGVVDGTHAARLGLLANHMAASFVAAGDGHAGSILGRDAQTVSQLLLATPHAR